MNKITASILQTCRGGPMVSTLEGVHCTAKDIHISKAFGIFPVGVAMLLVLLSPMKVRLRSRALSCSMLVRKADQKHCVYQC